MADRFEPGDQVQAPLGKGVVLERRNGGRLLVEVRGRTVVVAERDVRRQPTQGGRSRQPAGAEPTVHAALVSSEHTGSSTGSRTWRIDFHGLTVEEAIVRATETLNDALLADVGTLHLIHGRSGGRLRAALQRLFAGSAHVRSVRLDPRNAGVTIVTL